VGHEIDFTLCDFAADRRAETPSAAAELISSEFVACAQRAAQADDAMTASLDGAMARAGERLDHARSRLRLLSPEAQIEQGFLRLDDLSNRLGAALRTSVQVRRQQWGDVRAALARVSPEFRVQTESHRLLSLWKRLQAASPASVLNRGFVILRDEAGKPVGRRAEVEIGQVLQAEFMDGMRTMRAE
jgi:exodeoxyribonuclease VII large subunit